MGANVNVTKIFQLLLILGALLNRWCLEKPSYFLRFRADTLAFRMVFWRTTHEGTLTNLYNCSEPKFLYFQKVITIIGKCLEQFFTITKQSVDVDNMIIFIIQTVKQFHSLMFEEVLTLMEAIINILHKMPLNLTIMLNFTFCNFSFYM